MKLDGSRALGLVGQPGFCAWPGRIRTFVNLIADIKLCMCPLFDDNLNIFELLNVSMLSIMTRICPGELSALPWLFSLFVYKAWRSHGVRPHRLPDRSIAHGLDVFDRWYVRLLKLNDAFTECLLTIGFGRV